MGGPALRAARLVEITAKGSLEIWELQDRHRGTTKCSGGSHPPSW